MLDLSITLPLRVENGGLFISRGVGSHPARRLNSWELIFVERGCLQIREEGTCFSVRAGESLLLKPGRQHVGEGTFPSDLRFYWLHFKFDGQPQGSGPLSIPQHVSVDEPQYIIALFRQFLTEQESIERSIALECILLLILQRLSAAGSQEKSGEGPGQALAWKAQQIIRTRFHLPMTASRLAKELHCNPDYLGRVYRRAFRLTLTEAIHRQRVLAAEKLLLSDSLSLREVAERCGFSDSGYFRKIFHKYTGLTPAAWKRRYCKEHINSG